MRKLALLTLPFLLIAGPALAQQSLTPHSGFDNQTGHAQNASRLSGLHTDNGQVHQMDTNAANSMGANTGANSGPASDPAFPDRLTTATAPTSQGGALPLAGQNTPGSGAYGGTTGGSTPDSGGNSPATPH
jgi:hypothetical protein